MRPNPPFSAPVSTLNSTEQSILLDGATAYMDVLRDTAILDLQRNNVEVIDEQLRQTQDRFNVGEVTRTDVAQAEARLAAARSEASLAEATLRNSIAVYRQVIGVEPAQLAPGRPLDRLTPRNVDAALKVALNEHPAIKARQHAVDVAELQVKIEQGALAPQLGVAGAIDQRYDRQSEGRQRPVRFSGRAADRADLRRRSGLCRDPPGQGDRPVSVVSRPIPCAIRFAPP